MSIRRRPLRERPSRSRRSCLWHSRTTRFLALDPLGLHADGGSVMVDSAGPSIIHKQGRGGVDGHIHHAADRPHRATFVEHREDLDTLRERELVHDRRDVKFYTCGQAVDCAVQKKAAVLRPPQLHAHFLDHHEPLSPSPGSERFLRLGRSAAVIACCGSTDPPDIHTNLRAATYATAEARSSRSQVIRHFYRAAPRYPVAKISE